MKICFECDTPLHLEIKPARSETCPNCDADVRVCLNCEFYDKASHNHCKEPQADTITEKDRANFCDFFRMGEREKKEFGGDKPEDDKLEALKKLFGEE